MDHHFPTSMRMRGQADGAAPDWHELEPDPLNHLSGQRRSSGWPVVGAVVALLAMLLVFHYVVRGSLRQSESRHKAVAVHAQAIWRCNNLQGREVSSSCRLQAGAEARRLALLQARQAPWREPDAAHGTFAQEATND